jgi:pSer/pThr/pTyr-binding forkhead associated (FHA) protein
MTKGEQVFVRDFDSTNGTFVNEQPVKGEVELHDGDNLKVGPLLFVVGIEAKTPVESKVPVPQPAGKSDEGEEDIAAMLLGIQDGDTSALTGTGEESIPSGSTVMEVPAVNPGQEGTPGADKDKAKANSANTSSAAEAILKKYMRRPRA